MKQYLKMADVFDGHVVANHGDDFNGWSTVDTSLGLSIDESGDGGFESKTADYVAHAINSHDELVQMNQELLAALESVIEWYDMEADHSIEPDFYKRMAAYQASEDMAREAIAKAKGGAA